MIDFTQLTPELIVFALFCFAFLLQLWYYFGIFGKLAFFKKNETAVELPPASIIICARNEDDNLMEFLPKVMEQDYPNYEVIVVNDGSWDNTQDVLKEFTKKYNRLKIVTIKEDETHEHGKKFAVMVGIKGAQNEHLLFTDADCKPNSKDWLKLMMSNFGGETEIVLGYGAFEKTKGFINKVIRFDAFYIALQYLSFSLAGKTYMGVGRNLAYRKSLFFKMKGFASHYHIASGDDDLFVNEAATKRNSKIEVSIDSYTISKVKKTFASWFRQKRRHVTTFPYYSFKSKMRLMTLGFSQYLFFTTFITLLIMHFNVEIVLALFAFRFLSQLLIFKKTMDKLSEPDLLLFSPVLEIGMMFFYPILTIANLFLTKSKWKS